MGAEYLGEMNIKWAERIESIPNGVPGNGPMTLMKAIMNDYWADIAHVPRPWSADRVEEVMSKLYWCWVAWLDCTHFEVDEQ